MHSRVWSTSEALPDDNDQVSAGAGQIRGHMVDVRERLALDHIFASSTATDGYHTTIHLQGRGDNPTALASYALLFAKTGAAGGVELYVVGSGTQVTQVTTGGYVKDAFISGDWILSSVSGAHAGWTNVSATYANKFIRVGTSGLVSGGADTHTQTVTLVTANLPSHTHTISIWGQGASADSGKISAQSTTSNTSQDTGATGSGTAATTSSGDNVPVYVQVVIFQKD